MIARRPLLAAFLLGLVGALVAGAAPARAQELEKLEFVTRSGVHVVTEKYADFWMSNPAAGYSNVHERWAVRISKTCLCRHSSTATRLARWNGACAPR